MYQEILVDRIVHAAIGRFLLSHSTFEKHDIPTLIKDVHIDRTVHVQFVQFVLNSCLFYAYIDS
jgi:hypothetical protein